jgi:hypothetical protein
MPSPSPLKCVPIARTPLSFIDEAAMRVIDHLDWESILPGLPAPPVERVALASDLSIEQPYRFVMATEVLNGVQQRRFRMSVEFIAISLEFVQLLGDAIVGCLADQVGAHQISNPVPRIFQTRRDGVRVFVYSIEFSLAR